MHTKPCNKGNYPMKLATLHANLGHCRVPPDHRHNPLIEVTEGFSRLACGIQCDIPGAPLAALLCNGCELRQWLAIHARDIREIPQGIDTLEALHCEVRLNINAATRTELDIQIGGQCRCLQASSPDDGSSLDPGSV